MLHIQCSFIVRWVLQGFLGLLNSGNSCWANAVIQALLAVPELPAFLLNSNKLAFTFGQNGKKSVTAAFAELVQTMWLSQRAISPSR